MLSTLCYVILLLFKRPFFFLMSDKKVKKSGNEHMRTKYKKLKHQIQRQLRQSYWHYIEEIITPKNDDNYLNHVIFPSISINLIVIHSWESHEINRAIGFFPYYHNRII